MGITLSLVSALAWGTADFLARHATRRIGTFCTLLYMQFFGLAGLTIYLLLDSTVQHTFSTATLQDWLWAAAVALLSMVAILALYRSFEIGTLSIVSPIAASFAALIVVLSVASGETLDGLRTVGVVLTVAGVVLVSRIASESVEHVAQRGLFGLPEGVAWALLAAICSGFAFWLLGFQVTPRLGVVLPVWLIRLVTPPVLLLVAMPLKQNFRPPVGIIWWALAGVGILDTLGFLAGTAALHLGPVSITGVVLSLFSAVTVLLAYVFLHEKMRRVQWLGVAVIFAGVALVSG